MCPDVFAGPLGAIPVRHIRQHTSAYVSIRRMCPVVFAGASGTIPVFFLSAELVCLSAYPSTRTQCLSTQCTRTRTLRYQTEISVCVCSCSDTLRYQCACARAQCACAHTQCLSVCIHEHTHTGGIHAGLISLWMHVYSICSEYLVPRVLDSSAYICRFTEAS